jgi:hypothetical protein
MHTAEHFVRSYVHPPRMKIPRCFCHFSSTLLLAAALALPARADEQVTVRYSHSADNPLMLGSTPGGEVGVDAAFFDWRSSAALTEATKLNYGVSWSGYDFSRSGPMAVPEKLQEISLAIGATHRLSPQWLLIASVQPGLYGDLEGGSHEAFNAPVMFLATWLQSRELAWSFGLRADPFADKPVLPFIGVNWRFAPQWEFTIGFPRAGFGYEVSPALKLGLGLTVQGGSFHIADDPRPVSIGQRLDDTYLDYREIRVGLSADYKFNDTLSLAVEAGAITDQKFDYYERGYTLNGDTAAFFTIGLTGRF